MNLKQLKKFAENTPLACHNSQFEARWLLNRGINPNIVDDTKLLAYLYDERLPLDLESLCLRFGIDKVFKESYGTEVTELQGEELRTRNAKDARNTLLLRNKLITLLSPAELKVYREVFIPASKSLALIENNGVCVDYNGTVQLIVDIQDKIKAIGLENDSSIKEFEATQNKVFNIDSWLHRGVLIYGILGYKPMAFDQAKTKASSPSTGIKVLRKLLAERYTETLDKIIQVSALHGWKETYESWFKDCPRCGGSHIVSKDEHNFIYPDIWIGDTTTGRTKSSHPNMQNIPKREGGEWTRKVFVSRFPDGYLLEADYSGIELRILAALSGDEKLLQDFADGKDLHVEMAKEAFGIKEVNDEERHRGKILNYCVPFGRGASGIAFDIGTDVDTARNWLKRYWKNHPKLKNYLTSIPTSGIIYSPTGMKRHTTTWTQGKNFGIQNTALVVLLTALNRTVWWAQDNEYLPVLTIHDSVMFDIRDCHKKTIRQIKERLEFKAEEFAKWLPIDLPVEVKIGKDWSKMEKI